MTKKILFSTLLSISCLLTVTLVSTSDANAQAQGRYANRYSKRDVGGIINRLEQSSNTFSREFDRAMDQSQINGTPAEDRFNRNVRDYETSLDRLRSEFDSSDSWWESRNNVENVLREAQPVNVMMNTLPFRQRLEAQWRRMRQDINTLADTYDLRGLNGGGWNGGGGNGGGQQGDVPNWAIGTFYGRNENQDITLVISRNGRVAADIGGIVSYGSMYRSTLTINGATARVTRLNNGISAVRTDNGLRIDYLKTNSGGGGNGGGGQQGDVPSWAVGTFYGRSPEGEPITLTISNNGRVTANINGNASYGRIYGDRMEIGGAIARITRRNDGISAVRTDNGLRIDYSRSGGGSNPGGGQQGDVPNWALGTFYGADPGDGRTIVLTITANGSVIANLGGGNQYGTIYRNRLVIDGAEATIERTRNGFRATRSDNGLQIDYSRR